MPSAASRTARRAPRPAPPGAGTNPSTERPSSPATSSRAALEPYPRSSSERTRWILARRGPRNLLDPRRAYAASVEDERTEAGGIVPVATIFLTNRECPWTCLMCDLWKNTREETVPPGAIPEQIRRALPDLPLARRLKLYNAGSFFDPKAVPPQDHAAIARLASPFERVVIESHPALVGEDCFRFGRLLGEGRLEVALGLETVHPRVLPRLNKGMTAQDFRSAARALVSQGIAARAFVLVGLPYVSPEESRASCRESVAFAFDAGVGAVALIPTRAGNGALDALAASGDFTPPTLSLVEACLSDAIHLARGRVFADLWDLPRLAACSACFSGRTDRLRRMNLSQTIAAPVPCPSCGGSA